MSRTPGNGKTASAAASGGRLSGATAPAPARRSSIDKPGATAAAAKPRLSDKDRKKLMLGVSCLVVGLCVISVYGYFSWLRKPAYVEPPLNADVKTVKDFVISPTFDALSFDRQLIWMEAVGDKKKEMNEMYRNGTMNQEQFQDAKAVAWLGKRFRQIQRYKSMHALQRKAYLDQMIAEDIADDKKEEQMSQAEKLPPRDKDRVKLLVAKFPEAQRLDYEMFRKALKDREDELKKAEKARKKAAEAASRPTSRPAERPTGRE